MSAHVDYIFCVNTGRAGSEYFSKIFDHVEGCLSTHEPGPVCNGLIMQKYLHGEPGPMEELAARKAQRIRDQKHRCEVYAESNHCFIKGYGWLLPKHLPEERIGIVVLTRDRNKVAESLLRIGCSPLVQLGRDWVMLPTLKDPLVPPPRRLLSVKATYFWFNLFKLPFKNEKFYRRLHLKKPKTPAWITRYELDCLRWYFDETQARAEAYARRFSKVKSYKVDIEELNSPEGLARMLEFFGCTAKPSMADVLGKPVNLKSDLHHQ